MAVSLSSDISNSKILGSMLDKMWLLTDYLETNKQKQKQKQNTKKKSPYFILMVFFPQLWSTLERSKPLTPNLFQKHKKFLKGHLFNYLWNFYVLKTGGEKQEKILPIEYGSQNTWLVDVEITICL